MWKLWIAAGSVGALLASATAIQTLRLNDAELGETAERERADAIVAVVKALRADAEHAAGSSPTTPPRSRHFRSANVIYATLSSARRPRRPALLGRE